MASKVSRPTICATSHFSPIHSFWSLGSSIVRHFSSRVCMERNVLLPYHNKESRLWQNSSARPVSRYIHPGHMPFEPYLGSKKYFIAETFRIAYLRCLLYPHQVSKSSSDEILRNWIFEILCCKMNKIDKMTFFTLYLQANLENFPVPYHYIIYITKKVRPSSQWILKNITTCPIVFPRERW